MLAILVLLLLAGGTMQAAAQPMTLIPEGATVMGGVNLGDYADGPAGKSRVTFPSGLCGSYNSASTTVNGVTSLEMLLVGSTGYFRTLNRTDYTAGTWFGDGLGTGNSDGPIASAAVSQVFGCVRYGGSNTMDGIIYFVSSDATIRWVENGVVSSTVVTTDPAIAFVSVDVFNNVLYAISHTTIQVFRCDISFVSPRPRCTALPLTGINSGSSQAGIAVSSSGIFLANYKGLYWFNAATNQLINSITTIPFVDVRYVADSDEVYAITSSAIYKIDVGPGNNLAARVLSGVESSEYCESNSDGPTPSFCGMYRLYPVSRDEIYVTLGRRHAVRAMVLPPVPVPLVFFRRPFPIGMVDADAATNQLYALTNSIINGNLSTRYTAVDANTAVVDPTWWSTDTAVKVHQRNFDTTTTTPTIKQSNYAQVLLQLSEYYNLTDEVVYSDDNLLPMCDIELMRLLEHAVAEHARLVLSYPVIYTDPAITMTINGNPSITMIKLLLPAPFGNVAPHTTNVTTHDFLEVEGNFSTVILETMRRSMAATQQYTQRFDGSVIQFERLTSEADLQRVRFMVRDNLFKQLNACAREMGEAVMPIVDSPGSTGDGAHGGVPTDVEGGLRTGLVPGCVSKVGITNKTVTEKVGSSGMWHSYELFFAPSAFQYTFDLERCLDGADWKELEWWVNNHTVTKKKKYDTGCIVGIAVAAAVVVAAIVVGVVVWTSKRKRLATAVAAPALIGGSVGPKFSGTLSDEGEEMSTSNSRNPFLKKVDEY